METKSNKVYALSYSSFMSEDSELFVQTLGIYKSLEDAIDAMEESVAQDIDDGDAEYYWDISGSIATYKDDFGNEYKAYNINSINL